MLKRSLIFVLFCVVSFFVFRACSIQAQEVIRLTPIVRPLELPFSSDTDSDLDVDTDSKSDSVSDKSADTIDAVEGVAVKPTIDKPIIDEGKKIESISVKKEPIQAEINIDTSSQSSPVYKPSLLDVSSGLTNKQILKISDKIRELSYLDVDVPFEKAVMGHLRTNKNIGTIITVISTLFVSAGVPSLVYGIYPESFRGSCINHPDAYTYDQGEYQYCYYKERYVPSATIAGVISTVVGTALFTYGLTKFVINNKRIQSIDKTKIVKRYRVKDKL